MWMIAKVTIVQTMPLAMMKSMDLPVNVLLDGVEPIVIRVRDEDSSAVLKLK